MTSNDFYKSNARLFQVIAQGIGWLIKVKVSYRVYWLIIKAVYFGL